VARPVRRRARRRFLASVRWTAGDGALLAAEDDAGERGCRGVGQARRPSARPSRGSGPRRCCLRRTATGGRVIAAGSGARMSWPSQNVASVTPGAKRSRLPWLIRALRLIAFMGSAVNRVALIHRGNWSRHLLAVRAGRGGRPAGFRGNSVPGGNLGAVFDAFSSAGHRSSARRSAPARD
jgi:hypothetical protein